MKQSETRARCPTCKTLFYWSATSPCRPFCSERCRLIDLGEWLDGSHRVKADMAQPAPFPQHDD
ncbi:MAG: DNA gyrase inhibitor YacG [Gammaproteobacteria bacterium]|nr:DNA gyrase inhibitor YacG [Gammaproteobacteria bacterium]